MKGIAKKLMTVGLAGIMLGGVIGLAGCQREFDKTETHDTDIWLKNTYIVVTENGVETLHRGDVYSNNSSKWSTSPMYLKFNCGKTLQTSQYVAYLQSRPESSKYDKVCECAYEWISEKN